MPPPTGPEHVGTIAVPVFDASRKRELMIQIWYPTRATRGRPAPYFSTAVARLVAAADHVPVSVATILATHAFEASKPAPGQHPVVLYSPGSEVVPVMIWELWQNGQYVELSALGVMLIAALFCFVMLAQFAGKKFGVAEA